MEKSIIQIVVLEQDAGERIDKYLSRLSIISSRSFAQNLIDKSFILVNGKSIKSSYVLNVGDQIDIQLPEPTPTEIVPWDYALDIHFEDDDLLVINKPSGLVVHPAHGHEQDTLVNALLAHTKKLSMKNEQRPGIVHRIDKETSGLLVVAKNDFTHENLSQQFKNKTTHRIYYAVTQGAFKKDSGFVESYLARHPTDRKRYASVKIAFPAPVENAKWAKTHYRCLKKNSKMSYVQLQLETGRTHQIRVHMKELGHVLMGDLLYGFKKSEYDQLNLKRFYLHAAELGFVHPKTQKNMLFKSSWPHEDLEQIQKWGFNP